MVSPGEWGPNAWNLLHGLAERIGNQPLPRLEFDEQNELKFVLKDFWSLLPCKTCQGHYREWIRKNPPEAFTTKSGEYLKEGMRLWLYNLHEAVNGRREVASGFTEEMLTEKYSKIDLRENAQVLKGVYQRGLQTGVLKPEEWKKSWKHLDLLLRILGT